MAQDKANAYERIIQKSEPLENNNALDAEFHQERILHKMIKKSRNRTEQKN